MATPKKPLTDAAIARMKPGDKPLKITDTRAVGLHLLISVAGTKTFRYRYQKNRQEFVITLGRYQPKVPKYHMSLARARSEAWRLKAEVLAGEHPAIDRDLQKETDRVTFEQAAKDYMKTALPGMKKSTAYTTKRAFKYSKPLHNLQLNKIRPVEFRSVIVELAEAGKMETAKKTRSFLSKVCRHAVGLGWRDRNPIPDLPPLAKKKAVGRPAITDQDELGKLLRAIDSYDINQTFRIYMKILPHVFTRPGELRLAKWHEIDLKRNRWTIPAERMKMAREHVVPLSTQVRDLFMDLTGYTDTAPDALVFPSTNKLDKPMSENTANFILRQLGYNTRTKHTAHGFRKTASTLLNEAGKDREVIELCLAHGDPDKVRAAYNFAEMMQDRTNLMQWWSDYLDSLKKDRA